MTPASPLRTGTKATVLRNIIFDWSGTLVDDLPAVWQATNHVFQQAGVPVLTLDQFRAEFTLPFQGFYQRYTPHIPLPRLEEWFHGRFRELQGEVVELPHARRFLELCRGVGCRTFLLSTIHRDHYAAQSSKNGFDRFMDRSYIEAWNKKEWIHRVLQENDLKPEETLFIGDMEHDIETAHHAGVFSCAVLTGYTQLDQLRASKPHLIVENLGELHLLLEGNGFEFPPKASYQSEVSPPPAAGALRPNEADPVLRDPPKTKRPLAMDKITVCDLEVHYRVGVPDAERRAPQRLLISLDLYRDLQAAADSDALESTTNYFAVTERLKAFGEGREWRLIEALAGDIVRMVQEEFRIPRITVTIKKFIIPEARYVAVTLTRGVAD